MKKNNLSQPSTFFNHLVIILFFTCLTLLQMLPLIIKMNHAVIGESDTLLNIWALRWVQHTLFSDPLNLFNGNIFYPHANSLCFSEVMLPNAVIAFPIYIIFKNPVLAYNFVFLLSFVLSGYGAYLFSKEITGSSLAGILAGVIYGFNSFRLIHLVHLQILSSEWIPFTFLFLWRLWKKPSYKNAIFFGIFFILQSLTSGYLAVYLSISIIIFIISLLFWENLRKYWSFLKYLFVISLPVAIILIIFFLPYWHLHQEIALQREIEPQWSKEGNWSFGLESYLSAPANSYFWKNVYQFLASKLYSAEPKAPLNLEEITSSSIPELDSELSNNHDLRKSYPFFSKKDFVFSKAEGKLFPGIITLLFVFLGIIYKPIDRNVHIMRNTFFFMAFIIFIFSLGTDITWCGKHLFWGPYQLLYNYLPIFRGLRVPARFAIMVFFALSVLASVGVANLISKFKNQILSCPPKKLIYGIKILILLHVLEFWFYPDQPLTNLAVGEKNIPKVYQWLAENPNKSALLELPINWEKSYLSEAYAMYYSIYHWRAMINGFSGFFPPAYEAFYEVMKSFPNPQAFSAIQNFNIHHLMVRREAFPRAQQKEAPSEITRLYPSIKLVYQEPELWVYEFPYSSENIFDKNIVIAPLLPIYPFSKSVSSDLNYSTAYSAVDRDFQTAWQISEEVKAGNYWQVDLGNIYQIKAVKFMVQVFPYISPLSMILRGSQDGLNWFNLDEPFYPHGSYLLSLVKNPTNPFFVVQFPTKSIRWLQIRFSQTFHFKKDLWINEILFYGEDKTIS